MATFATRQDNSRRSAVTPRTEGFLGNWLLRVYLIVALLLMTVAVAQLPFGSNEKATAMVCGPAFPAAVGLGGIGAVMGAINGWQRQSIRFVVFGTILFGLAGIFAGISIGGLLATLVSPAAQVLSEPGK